MLGKESKLGINNSVLTYIAIITQPFLQFRNNMAISIPFLEIVNVGSQANFQPSLPNKNDLGYPRYNWERANSNNIEAHNFQNERYLIEKYVTMK